jgi:hypothetical protein
LKRLKAGTVVLVGVTSDDVERAYLSVVNPDTLVLVPRATAQLNIPAPAPPVPAPKPRQ